MCVDEDAVVLLEICKKHPEVRPCIGIHPWYIHNESLEKVEELIKKNKDIIVGIGEVGLDGAKHLVEENTVRFYIFYI